MPLALPLFSGHRINEETSSVIGLPTVKHAKVFADYVAMQKQGMAEVDNRFYSLGDVFSTRNPINLLINFIPCTVHTLIIL